MLCVPCCTPCCDPCTDQACPAGDAGKHNSHCNTGGGCNYWVSLLGGVRYLQLDEGLAIEDSHGEPGPACGQPALWRQHHRSADQFGTHNYFYGGQIGAEAEICWGEYSSMSRARSPWAERMRSLTFKARRRSPRRAGTTVVIPAGFLASGSNSGHFSRDRVCGGPRTRGQRRLPDHQICGHSSGTRSCTGVRSSVRGIRSIRA